MEATGVYWKPVWAILEDDFELLLVNARHVKQVPGRKTDVSDAAWLCQLAEAGLLRASFVPPKPIRTLRNLTRYRKTQIQERAAGGQPAAQGARGHRDQARLRRHRHPRRLGPGDARRARVPARPTRRCSPTSPRAGCARRSRRCGKRSRAASTACTRCGSARSSPTSTSSTSRSTRSPKRSRSRSPLSRRPLSCSARSPASNGAPPRRSSPRSAST